MAIEKLTEFAKDGQKNVDGLTETDGFPVLTKPARQWFNWLFNSITTKINEIIDQKIDFEDIIDNLTTNDATQPVSAKQAKVLQDNKLDKTSNAVSATKLATARTIGGVSFDGTANINLPGVNAAGNQNTTGNAATATKLATAQTIALTGAAQGSATFDGSGNISISTTGLGVGQTWISVTGSRTNGTTYTNSTGKPIFVWVSIRDTNGSGVSVTINGTSVMSINNDLPAWYYYPFIFVVPPNQTYRVSWAGGTNSELIDWSELR